MSQQNGVDRRRLDAGKHQVGFQSAAPLLDTTRPAIDENSAARAAHHVTVDMHRVGRLLSGITLDSGGVRGLDIREEVEAGGEIAVADGGNREFPELLTGKDKVGHRAAPERLIAGVNVWG